MELGGTWISPDHVAFLKLCSELDVDVFRASFLETGGNDEAPVSTEEWPWWYCGPEYREEEMQMAKKTIFHHSQKDGHAKFSFRGPSELMSQLNSDAVAELEKVGTIIDTERLDDLSWDTRNPGIHWNEMDSQTTSTKLLSCIKTNQARNVVRIVIHNKNAQEPEQVSFLYNMISFKGCNSTGPDSEYRVRGGTQAVPLAIANKLGPKRLTLGDAVKGIQVKTEGQQVCVTTKSGKTFICKALIVTGSPPAILSIDFDPPLPSIHSQLLQRMPMGTSRKFMAIYKRGPWWREYGYNGDILASGLPKELSISIGEDQVPIFGQCFDTSPYSQEFGVLTCFVEGRQNLYFSSLTEEQQQDLMQQFLRLTFHDLEMESKQSSLWEPDYYETYNWSDDMYVRGAYTAYFPPGVLSVPEWWEAYRCIEKMPGVFVAGADYHVGFGNGYIEGAVRSGQQAADLASKRISIA